jgi:hypothetical protein
MFFGNFLKKVSAPSKTSKKKDISKSKFILSRLARAQALNLKNKSLYRALAGAWSALTRSQRADEKI